MNSVIKKCAVFSAAAISALSIFAGTVCFAATEEPALDAEYSTVETVEVQNTADIAGDIEVQTVDEPKSKSEDESVGKSLAIGVGSGFVITIIVCVCIYFSYKRHGATEPYNYNENAKLTLIDSSDVLINTHIEKRKIDKD